jgi:hypothetical protein
MHVDILQGVIDSRERHSTGSCIRTLDCRYLIYTLKQHVSQPHTRIGHQTISTCAAIIRHHEALVARRRSLTAYNKREEHIALAGPFDAR